MDCCKNKISIIGLIWTACQLAVLLFLLRWILPCTVFGEMFREAAKLFR